MIWILQNVKKYAWSCHANSPLHELNSHLIPPLNSLLKLTKNHNTRSLNSMSLYHLRFLISKWWIGTWSLVSCSCSGCLWNTRRCCGWRRRRCRGSRRGSEGIRSNKIRWTSTWTKVLQAVRRSVFVSCFRRGVFLCFFRIVLGLLIC